MKLTNCCKVPQDGHYSTKCHKCFSLRDEWNLFHSLMDTEHKSYRKKEITKEVYRHNIDKICKYDMPQIKEEL